MKRDLFALDADEIDLIELDVIRRVAKRSAELDANIHPAYILICLFACCYTLLKIVWTISRSAVLCSDKQVGVILVL